jgi:hypothetical protein
MAVPISWNTFRMFRAASGGTWRRHLFIAQCCSIVVGVLIGTFVVGRFFKGIMDRCGPDASGRRATLRVWMSGHTVALRLVKFLAVFEPSVLRVIDSRLCGLSLFSIPVSTFFVGWRWMWIGDGLVTVVMDGGQVVIGLIRDQMTPGSSHGFNVEVGWAGCGCVCVCVCVCVASMMCPS